MSDVDDLEYVVTAWNAGDYARVVERGSAVIASGADASAIVMLYGAALDELDRTAEARDAFTLALSILPPERHVRVLGALAALELNAGSYAEAERHCQRAIELAPDHASAYIYLGCVYRDTDRDREAEAQFIRATCCTEGAIDEGWFNLGATQRDLGKVMEAASSFRRALALDPDYELAREELASLESQRDDASGT